MTRMRGLVVLAVLLVAGQNGFGGGGRGGGGGGGGGGGVQGALQQDQDLQQAGQRMDAIQAQVMANMQNAGQDAQGFMQNLQQQMRDGTLDVNAVEQDLLTKGIMTQDMVQEVNATLQQMQAGLNRTLANATYERIRQLLGPTDEEWAILQPKVQRVLAAQAEVAQGGETLNQGNTVLGIGGRMGGGGMGTGMYFVSQMAGPQGSQTELGRAWKALQVAVEDKRVGDVELSSRLATWRILHEQARAELKAAQADLVGMLTLRQEGVMMSVGVL